MQPIVKNEDMLIYCRQSLERPNKHLSEQIFHEVFPTRPIIMDAKPQRPRATRVYGDENAAPNMLPQKAIHQRHKSSPALSSMANADGLKAAAKRTAFGDVSNTANMVRPSNDDSVTVQKSESIIEKLAPLRADQKNVSLLRPAQRPVPAVPKISTGTSLDPSAMAPLKHPLAEIQTSQPANQVANMRRVLTKKSTTVFKDNAPAPVIEGSEREMPKHLSSNAPAAPVHRDLQSQHLSQPDCKEPEARLRRIKSKAAVDAPARMASGEPLVVAVPPEEPTAVRSDGIYIDERGEVQIYQFTDDLDPSLQDSIPTLEEGVALPSDFMPKSHNSISSKRPDGALGTGNVQPTQQLIKKHQQPIPISEPEEYWEEDDENYGEEGYVTAPSYKSRGENTTSGATTVLFPKMSQKTKKELASASAWMDAAKAAGDLEDETWDTTMVAEYGDEIFQYMRELEVKMLPNAHYMDNQAEIQWSMRSVLMDWLVQVHHRFGLLPETLFLCCNYIDRFLSCKIVSLGKLQLVGATAIFIAAKYEEINCPSVQEIVYMVDNGYTVDEILKAERFMLSMLQFELGWPGPMSFLRRISKADDYDLETRTLAKYFLELTIMDERFVGSPPSFLAAGAHCLARMMLKKGPWSIEHIYFSNYTYSQLHSLVLLILECCENPQKHHYAIFDKYADKRYKRASQFVQSEMIKGFQATETAATDLLTYSLRYEDKAICAY